MYIILKENETQDQYLSGGKNSIKWENNRKESKQFKTKEEAEKHIYNNGLKWLCKLLIERY